MVETAAHLMRCGLFVPYAYTHTDEISLLFRADEQAYARELRKLISVLASEAGGKMSLLLGAVASFDCRVIQLPTEAQAVDYFCWRREVLAHQVRRRAPRTTLPLQCFAGTSLWWIPEKHEGTDPRDGTRHAGLRWRLNSQGGPHPKSDFEALVSARVSEAMVRHTTVPGHQGRSPLDPAMPVGDGPGS